jgi:hypothetical protein
MSTMHKARVAALAVGTTAIMAAGASAASATTLRSGSATGAALASGSTISGPLTGTATLTTAFGNATCTVGSLGGTVGTNPAATVLLTSPVLSLGSYPGTPCNGPGTSAPFRIFDAQLISAGSVGVTSNAAGTGGSLVASTVVVRARIASPRTLSAPNGTCDFNVNTAAGVAQNADNSVTFTNVPITSATGLCAQAINANSGFTAKFGPLKSGGANVFVTQ